MILLVDNYDSFTFNLAQVFGTLGCETLVVRNDWLTESELVALDVDGVVLSPGPKDPSATGPVMAALLHWRGRVPVLGVCLGHQCIAELFGARVGRARRPLHGRATAVTHCASDLFENVRSPMAAARYHSLSIDASSIQPPLRVDAMAEDGEVMAISDPYSHLYGVQFHPESYLTEDGARLISNFLAIVDARRAFRG